MQTIHRTTKCYCFITLLILVLIGGKNANAQIKEQKVVRVGWYESPFSRTDEQGNRSGYAYEYQMRIGSILGWSYEYVEQTWPNLLEMLSRGEIDLLSDVSVLPERKDAMLFSELEMAFEEYMMMIPKEGSNIKIGNPDSVNGKRIGIEKKSVQVSLFTKWLRTNRVKCELVELNANANEMIDMLSRGEIDGLVGPTSIDHGRFAPAFNIGSANVHFAINKAKPELKNELDMAMEQIRSTTPSFLHQLSGKYHSNFLYNVYLPEQESQWLNKRGKIRIGYRDNYMPFCKYDAETGEVDGLLRDFIDQSNGVFSNADFEIEAIAYPSITAAVEAVKAGEIDAAFPHGIEISDAEREGLVLSDPLYSSIEMAVMRQEDKFNPDDTLRAGLNNNNPNYISLLRFNYPHWTTVNFQTTPDCLDGIAKGEADLLLLSTYRLGVLGSYIRKNKLKSVPTGMTISYGFATRVGETELYNIVSRLSDMMDDNLVQSSIVSHSDISTSISTREFIEDNMFIIFGLLLTVLAIIYYYFRKSVYERHQAEKANSKLSVINEQMDARINEIQNLNEELEKQYSVILATSQRYFCIYGVDVNEDYFFEVISLPRMEEVLGKEGVASTSLEKACQLLVKKEDLSEVKAFHDITRWNDLLKEKNIFNCEFRSINNRWCRGSIFAAKHDENGNVTNVVYTLEVIQEQKEAEQALKEANESLTEYAEAQRVQIDEIQRLNDLFKETQDFGIRQLMDMIIRNSGKSSLIDDIVKIVGEYYKADRAYVFERDITGKYTVNTYEWCADGVTPQKDNLQQVPINVVDSWMDAFRRKGWFYIELSEEYAKNEPRLYEVLEPQGISSLMAAPMVIDGDFFGFVGVDNPTDNIDHELYIKVAATSINHELHIIDEKEKEKQVKEELEKSKEAAEVANQAKTSFLFNMSHDIRTPMNAIIGFTDLLQKHQDNPEKCVDYISKIKKSSSVMLSIINNVLEMARIEKGNVKVEEIATTSEMFNSTLIDVFEGMMKQKSLEFKYSLDIQHHKVLCDPVKLREVFYNLLSNAYKYTEKGSVVMALKEIPSNREGYAMYQTTITDTGIGMSEEFLPHLFEEFARENTTTENKIEGTGLGMPIVKRLVELMEGTIEVKSHKGVGTTFVVTLPHKIAEDADVQIVGSAEISLNKFNGKRILLAEDNDLNAEIAIEILSEVGFVIDRAEDGDYVLQMLEKADSDYYDIILMDVQMPRMNGYEASRLIRQMSDKKKANIPILAMTANAFAEDKKNALEAGMDGHLAKPINVTELMKILSGLLDKRQRALEL